MEVEEGEVCELQGGNQPTCITGSGSAARASAGLSVRSEAMSSCLTTATCVCGYVHVQGRHIWAYDRMEA